MLGIFEKQDILKFRLMYGINLICLIAALFFLIMSTSDKTELYDRRGVDVELETMKTIMYIVCSLILIVCSVKDWSNKGLFSSELGLVLR